MLLPALLFLLLCWCNRRMDAPEDQPVELCQSDAMRSVFILGVLGFALVAIGLPLTTGETEYSPYLAGIALLCALLSPFAFLSCIRYGESGLTIRTCFGRIYALRWEDVTAVQAGAPARSRREPRRDGFIIAGGRRFFINYSLPGAQAFILRAQQACHR